MIAKLEWTQSTAKQNSEQLQNPKMEVTINNESTTIGPPPGADRSQSPWVRGGGLNAFYWYHIFALDPAVVEAQIC